jgi:hypothetical protein
MTIAGTMLFVAAAAIGAVPQRAGAPPAKDTHRADARIAYLGASLDALKKTPADQREHAHEYARVLEQGACASSVERLKVDCMMTASRRYCRRKGLSDLERCHATMDVVVSNVLASKRLINADKRYEIMKRFRDPRKELAREMRRIQGALAVDFRFRMGNTEDDATTARAIDTYCLATADETNIAWQSCASSLVWFLATGASGSEEKAGG